MSTDICIIITTSESLGGSIAAVNVREVPYKRNQLSYQCFGHKKYKQRENLRLKQQADRQNALFILFNSIVARHLGAHVDSVLLFI